MICPFCKYEHDGWSSTKLEPVEGEHGEFFKLPVELQRRTFYNDIDRKELFGCPACDHLFLA